jgi:hypothetical protein
MREGDDSASCPRRSLRLHEHLPARRRLRLHRHDVADVDRGFSGAAMNPRLEQAFEKEIASARALMLQNEHDRAFAHLERAHVLGQQHAVPHVLSHWLMLRVAAHRRDPAAMLGQAARIVLGAVGSLAGSVPTGNTGGTNISMFKRLPIEPALLEILEDRDARRS